MSFFKGTSTDQDPRFKDKQAMQIKKMSFPASFNTKVDMRKVEMAVMKPWIAKQVTTLLGFEDDVLIEYVNSLLEDDDHPIVDPKHLQVLLQGFLEDKTPTFMNQLWDLLLSAQANPLRVPTQLLEEKKKEMRDRAEKEALERRKAEQLELVRQRERDHRAGPPPTAPSSSSPRSLPLSFPFSLPLSFPFLLAFALAVAAAASARERPSPVVDSARSHSPPFERYDSRSRSRSRSRSPPPPPRRRRDDDDDEGGRRTNRWRENRSPSPDAELQKRESELKEGLLRKKVVASRASKEE
ncbi:hypothetical protein JCM11491_002694 [Sporobolomyces phaffii]